MPKEYQQFPISNFRTGFAEDVEPWLLPRDAFQIMKNAHLYRGVLEKIAGYRLYAKMSYRETIQLSGAINGSNKTFTGTLNHIPSTDNFTGQAATNSTATSIESWFYDSDGTSPIINLVSSGGGTGTVNLTTLAVSLTFNVAPAQVPAGGNIYNAVIFSYDFLSTASAGRTDIMGIKPYYARNGGQDILIFDTNRVAKVITIDSLFIQQAQLTDNATTEIPHEVHEEDVTTTPAFDGMAVTFTGTVNGHPLVPNSVEFTVYDNSNPAILLGTITDNGDGKLVGSLLDTTPGKESFINYFTGAWTMTFLVAPAATSTMNSSVCVYGDVFTGDFTNFFSVANYTFLAFITNNVDPIRYYDGMCLNYLNTNLTNRPGDFTYDISKCLHVAINRDRLLLILPTVEGNIEANDIYWSTLGKPLDFTNDEDLPAPTSESIRTFAFINSDLIIHFSNSERIFRYTGDAFDPFRWDTTNSIWRCDARYSAINYDSYFTAVGKPAIVSSDGVNIKRADEIIPDFTLNDRELMEGPIISIQQTSIGQCYGERFDDFKEGWLCFKAYDVNSNSLERSDNILAFNYLDGTYAVYTFPFNCLGFGTVTSLDTWGNNFDKWEDANYAWGTYYESLDALIDLGGDRNGNVYSLGVSNTLVTVDNETEPVRFDVITKNFNPFVEEGELCRFGYLDLFVSADTQTILRVQFYRDDTMYLDPNGDPAGFYQETILTFKTTDSMSPSTPQSKVWKRVYVGAVAKEHTIRFYQKLSDFEETDNQPVRIHAMNLYMKPAGRIFN